MQQVTALHAISEKDLPFRAKLLQRIARAWPFHRGRSFFIRNFQRLIEELPPFVLTRIKGLAKSIAIPRNDSTGLVLILYGEHDAHIGFHERYLLNIACDIAIAQPELTVLDVGANLGSFALVIATRCGKRCIAFEPQPDLAALLHKNATERLGIDSVEVRPYGLSNVSGTIGFERGPQNSGDARININSSDSSITIHRLDQVFSPDDWKDVCLMKIDVETHEPEVLEGAQKLWEHHRPPLIFEVLPHELAKQGKSCKEIGKFLRSNGYKNFMAIDRFLYPPELGVGYISNILAWGDRLPLPDIESRVHLRLPKYLSHTPLTPINF
ncbi:MAG: FkbM family methyltransferase [Candidatus Riflebacteria bacterium]|nr:FkbM family methyltransferase [Candidatus Riflebacteria bacterium]